MLRVLVDLNRKKPTVVVDAYDDPKDQGVDVLAEIMVDTVDVAAIVTARLDKEYAQKEKKSA